MDAGKDGLAGRWVGGPNDKTIISRIMLRFRPIAPKPVTGGSGSGHQPPEKKTELITEGRPKRKYVRTKKNIRCKKDKVGKSNDGFDRTVLTLQLLPPVGNRREPRAGGSGSDLDPPVMHPVQNLPIWLNFDNKLEKSTKIGFGASDRPDLTAVVSPRSVVESTVTVECVTDTCMDGGGLGSTDTEKIMNLEMDTCPGFISDCANRVQWVNQPYRRMVWAEEGGGPPPEAAAVLLVKAEMPVSYPAFACRIRVQYTWRGEKYSQTVPCDVWRMEFGGFAWRLDVKAALSLGR